MKIIIFLSLVFFLAGCQQINTNLELESLEKIALTKEEIEDLGIDINTTLGSVYTAGDYYSEYPNVEHAKGFEGSFLIRYYPYEISQFNYIHIGITIIDNSEHAKIFYEDQTRFLKSFYKISETNKNYSFGDESIIIERENNVDYMMAPKGYEIYFVKGKYFVEVRSILEQENPDIPLEKLIEIARIIEGRL